MSRTSDFEHITDAGNTVIPAALAIRALGYSLRCERSNEHELWIAQNPSQEFLAPDPLTLLGLIAMRGTRGREWRAPDDEIERFLEEYERPLPEHIASTRQKVTIQVLSGHEAVRLRPAMYLGQQSVTALYLLALDSVCEHLNESVRGCHFELLRDGSCSIRLNRGIAPVGVVSNFGITQPAIIPATLTLLTHHSGEFLGSSGAMLVALSRSLIVECCENGEKLTAEFGMGGLAAPVRLVPTDHSDQTTIEILPDSALLGPPPERVEQIQAAWEGRRNSHNVTFSSSERRFGEANDPRSTNVGI